MLIKVFVAALPWQVTMGQLMDKDWFGGLHSTTNH
jgi:hypothetical protein